MKKRPIRKKEIAFLEQLIAAILTAASNDSPFLNTASMTTDRKITSINLPDFFPIRDNNPPPSNKFPFFTHKNQFAYLPGTSSIVGQFRFCCFHWVPDPIGLPRLPSLPDPDNRVTDD
ncbi:hypothetical protein JTE90_027484 [Oedothorax gibbosus]|uniref:Uncharacterized protein n=1 Tax=Oedothorax gibbosus TaxID=931172 RepID=A0AAV6UG39_9ARAC|nr:hypothetical protein JTE90_027484 [Oedothorax gibbosus]